MNQHMREVLFHKTRRQIRVQAKAHPNRNQNLGKEEQKVGDLVHCNYSKQISHQQIESVFGRSAKVFAMNCCHYVSVSIHKFEEIFEAPEEAFATT